MARIAGVNIPTHKKLYVGLTYIYGVGKHSSRDICRRAKVNQNAKVSELSDTEIKKIREVIYSLHIVEGDLRIQVSLDIKNLVDIKSYRGMRHVKKLPVRGQRTHTNARTRRGKAIAIAGKKKITK